MVGRFARMQEGKKPSSLGEGILMVLLRFIFSLFLVDRSPEVSSVEAFAGLEAFTGTREHSLKARGAGKEIA